MPPRRAAEAMRWSDASLLLPIELWQYCSCNIDLRTVSCDGAMRCAIDAERPDAHPRRAPPGAARCQSRGPLNGGAMRGRIEAQVLSFIYLRYERSSAAQQLA